MIYQVIDVQILCLQNRLMMVVILDLHWKIQKITICWIDGDFDIQCLLDKDFQTIRNRNRNGKGNKKSPSQAQSLNQLRKIIPYIPPIMTTFIPPNKPNGVNINTEMILMVYVQTVLKDYFLNLIILIHFINF